MDPIYQSLFAGLLPKPSYPPPRTYQARRPTAQRKQLASRVTELGKLYEGIMEPPKQGRQPGLTLAQQEERIAKWTDEEIKGRREKYEAAYPGPMSLKEEQEFYYKRFNEERKHRMLYRGGLTSDQVDKDARKAAKTSLDEAKIERKSWAEGIEKFDEDYPGAHGRAVERMQVLLGGRAPPGSAAAGMSEEEGQQRALRQLRWQEETAAAPSQRVIDELYNADPQELERLRRHAVGPARTEAEHVQFNPEKDYGTYLEMHNWARTAGARGPLRIPTQMRMNAAERKLASGNYNPTGRRIADGWLHGNLSLKRKLRNKEIPRHLYEGIQEQALDNLRDANLSVHEVHEPTVQENWDANTIFPEGPDGPAYQQTRRNEAIQFNLVDTPKEEEKEPPQGSFRTEKTKINKKTGEQTKEIIEEPIIEEAEPPEVEPSPEPMPQAGGVPPEQVAEPKPMEQWSGQSLEADYGLTPEGIPADEFRARRFIEGLEAKAAHGQSLTPEEIAALRQLREGG